MSREPSVEQKKAIDSRGGVCLSAGAGSGKTFVIVEHLLSIISAERSKLIDPDETILRSNIRKFLGKLVVMTFTKKAAGELKARISGRLEAFSEDKYYSVVVEEISSVYIGTIHGFCFRLLRQGIFPGIDPEIEIISELRRKVHVLQMVKDFGHDEINKFNDDIKNLFFSSFEEIASGVTKILNDPDQRLTWDQKTSLNDIEIQKHHDFWEELAKIENLNLLFNKDFIAHKSYVEEKSKTWFSAIDDFILINSKSDLSLEEKTETFAAFFSKYKRIVKPKKIEDELVHEFISEISRFRKLFKKYEEEIRFYLDNSEEYFSKYFVFFCDVYKYVSSRLGSGKELTFSDLEYLALRELENNKESEALFRDLFRYFIVDEFQDTSNIQFRIIGHLVEKDYSNLFVVGDEKQSIYRFRGGEVSLFTHVMSLLPKRLSLTDNYRSTSGVIKFNNAFTSSIFPLGAGFDGRDQFAIVPKDQTIPEFKLESGNNGEVYHIIKKIQDDKKLSKQEIERLEASESISHFKNIRKKGDSYSFLYSKLSPVYFLIERLVTEKISFRAQVKVPFKDNPVMAICYAAISGYLSEKDKKTSLASWIVENIFTQIGHEKTHDTKAMLEQFYDDLNYFDFPSSMKKLIYSFGINSPDIAYNIEIISDLWRQTNGDLEGVLNFLQSELSNTYSFEYEFGTGEEKIEIMSVHASKGLEFDHVFIMGAMSNGVSRPMDSLLGKKFSAFKWKKSFRDLKFFKSPSYIIESHEDKVKDFSEQKRLIYVACTRAVQTLSFFSLESEGDGKVTSFGKNSWCHAYPFFENLLVTRIESNMECSEDERVTSHRLPFFQKDSCGLSGNSFFTEELLISAEMSASQLSDLALCSKFFYYKHLLKISEDNLETLSPVVLGLPPNLQKKYITAIKELGEKGDLSEVKSSAERGTKVHKMVESYLNGRDTTADFNNSQDREAFSYACSELERYLCGERYNLISERDLKFDLFTQKISSKPDLIIEDSDNSKTVEILDFKTGEKDSVVQNKYLMQLFIYASGYSQLYPEVEEFVLKLLYLDKKETFKLRLSKDQTLERLNNFLNNFNNFGFENKNYCQNCEFNKICLIGDV